VWNKGSKDPNAKAQRREERKVESCNKIVVISNAELFSAPQMILVLPSHIFATFATLRWSFQEANHGI
jgi:hypothetical protein